MADADPIPTSTIRLGSAAEVSAAGANAQDAPDSTPPALRIEARGRLTPGEVGAVQGLLDAAAAVDGVTPLDEGRWRQLHHAGGTPGLQALLVLRGGELAAYGHLQREPHGWSLAAATHPACRLDSGAITALLAAAAADAAGTGVPFSLWASQPRPEHERLAARLGLAGRRALYQMRRPLPVGEPFALHTRPFRPGQDEAGWLEANNRAFAWHPEQGGWDLAEVQAHEALPWFDPGGFLVHEEDGAMAGFCWTKIHTETDPPLGEIYVIATDPDRAGRGLGRLLTLAGLDYMARAGIGTGMLYVDADNVRAVKLYVDLGFVVHHVDVNFHGVLQLAEGAPPSAARRAP